ncbi:MAG: peptide chain release factor N(5)-glutamine methyltransferase [Kiritimatiellales bacterium]
MNLTESIKQLEAAGHGNAKRTAEELAAYLLKCKPLEVYFCECSPEQTVEFESLIARAVFCEPVQYIIGHVDFRGLNIKCDARALIPRAETELLVQAVLDKVDATPSSRNVRRERDEGVASTLQIVDVGTGTGCVGLSLLNEIPNANVVAVDISPDAVSLAQENATALGFEERFTAVQGDLLKVDATPSSRSLRTLRDEGVASTLFKEKSIDAVVANPPYIFSAVCMTLDRSVRDFEPRLALDGGADGMDLIRRLMPQAKAALKSGAGIFLEFGYNQGDAVRRCLIENGFQRVEIKQDYAGYDRIAIGFAP